MSVERLLVVCTANTCRSPMAEALLRHEAILRALSVEVASAGVRATDGHAAAHGSIEALRTLGHDLTSHRARALTDEVADAADLIITLEARHVIDVVGGRKDRFARTFTLRELVQRAHAVGLRGPRPLHESLSILGAGRRPSDVMSTHDLDVDDPYGGRASRYRACATHLVTLTTALATSLWGPAPTA